MTLLQQYLTVRKRTEEICKPLQKEDYVVQPVVDVSPPKWHLGHTTWFFEAFVLQQNLAGYCVYDGNYNYVFNSYYETAGARVIRTDRGNLSRPTVDDVYSYRQHVDKYMQQLLAAEPAAELYQLILLGLNHEQQHQELLVTDIKYILGHNPLFPAYSNDVLLHAKKVDKPAIHFPGGLVEIGYNGNGFCFDNELKKHQVFVQPFTLASQLATNEEYLEFMHDGGYKNFTYWHAEGWDWVKQNEIQAPLYWHKINDQWHHYTLQGLQPISPHDTLNHISYYEASAYAAWKGCRLPTEFEWEAASHLFDWGQRWEWTDSAYLPYPGFTKAPGAIGEYNGKFMVNQMVLRGASEATAKGHSRPSYRNFFHPHLRWQYTGIRLAK